MRLLESNVKIVGEAKEVEDYLAAVHEGGGWSKMALGVIWPSIKTERVIYAMFANPAFFFMIIGLYLGLIYYVDANFRSRRASWVTKIALGIPHAWCTYISAARDQHGPPARLQLLREGGNGLVDDDRRRHACIPRS